MKPQLSRITQILSVRCLLGVAVLALTHGASAAVFNIEPEGPLPVVKSDGARVYVGGHLNGMSDYCSTYLNAWIRLSSDVKHFKLFTAFSGAHSYDNAKTLPTTLANVKPDVVVMVLGVDALYYGMEEPRRSQFKENLVAMADACEKAGAKLVLFSLPAKYGTTSADANNQKLAAYADALKAFAQERKLCFFDLHRASYEFVPKQTAGCFNDLRMARFLLDLFGIKVDNPRLTVDYAAGKATVNAPSTVVAKGNGAYELTCPRPPLGFTYCDVEATKWVGLEIKAVNLPADCAEVKIAWKGRSVKVARADLEKGVNIRALDPGWSPFRDAGLRALGNGGKANPGWNQRVLTSRLPSFERTVVQMDSAHDRTDFFALLRREIYEGVDRDFDRAEAATAAYACGPSVTILTFTALAK